MTLRSKTLLVLALSLVGLCAAASTIVAKVWLEGVRDLEVERVRLDLERVREALADDVARVEHHVAEWAAAGGDEGYISSGPGVHGFEALELDAVAFVSADGRLEVSRAVDPATGRTVPLPEAVRELAVSGRLCESGDRAAGPLVLGGDEHHVAARRVGPRDAAGPRPVVLGVRTVDARALNGLARRTRVDATVLPVSGTTLPDDAARALSALSMGQPELVHPVDEEQIGAYALLRDATSRPTVLVRAVQPRDVYREGRLGLLCLLGSLLAVGVAIAAVTVALLERLVLSRLQRLGEQVRRVGATHDLSLRVDAAGGDELAATARTINTALDELEAARRERERTEAALRASEERLQHARRLESVGRLAGGVAHDFNNLLTIVLGYTELLVRKMREDDPSRVLVKEIRTAAERAATLTQQLLAFSRKQPAQPRLLDVGQHVVQHESMLRRLVGEDVQVRVATAPPLEPVLVDPQQLTQVLMNLAANARDAMPRGGTFSVDVHATRLDRTDGEVPPGRYVRIAVSDDGEGMDEATAARLFEPFFTTKAVGKGTGLGLASAHGIVHQAGGGIVVETSRGRGTTFRVYLPVAAQAPEAAAAAPETPRGAVLVFGEDAAFRSVVRDGLEAEGYAVFETSAVDEGLRAATDRSRALHCAVLEARPRSAELVRALRDRDPAVPSLVLSGDLNTAAVRTAFAEGAAFLANPFTPDALADAVRRCVASPPAVAAAAAG